MSERRHGLLLVGSEKQREYLDEYARWFNGHDIDVTYRGNIAKRVEDKQERIALEYHTTGDRPREEGERWFEHHLGRIASQAAALLVVNRAPDGDSEPYQKGDITLHEWCLLMRRDVPTYRFAVQSIPPNSGYSIFTHEANGLLAGNVVGGQLQVVANKIYEVEGRRKRI